MAFLAFTVLTERDTTGKEFEHPALKRIPAANKHWMWNRMIGEGKR